MIDADVQASQDQATRLFGELDRPALKVWNRDAVLVEDRMLFWDSDGNQWFMVWSPDPGRPHVLMHFGEPVGTRAQVIARSEELQQRLDLTR